MFSFLKKKDKNTGSDKIVLKACVSGQTMPVEALGDGVFSEKMMGEGIAIKPTGDTVVAPADGKISVVMEDTGHAVGLELSNGTQLLIHVGLDTVNMQGDGFKVYTVPGREVKCGDKLICFDSQKIKAAGYPDTVVFVVAEPGPITKYNFAPDAEVTAGESVVGEIC